MKSKSKSPVLIILWFVILIIFTVFDRNISEEIVNQDSLFGYVMEHITVVPYVYVLLISASIILVTAEYQKKSKSTFKMLLSVIYYILSLLFSSLAIYQYLSMAGVIVHLILAVIVIFITRGIKADNIKYARKAALVMGLVFIFSMVTVESIKPVWGRVRPREIISLNNPDLFTNWYQINGSKYSEIVSSSQEIKSFPSGHSQWGATAICLSLLAPLFIKNEEKRNYVLYICIIWMLLVMLSRVIVAAHFPTDTFFGASITIAYFLLFNKLVFKQAYPLSMNEH